MRLCSYTAAASAASTVVSTMSTTLAAAAAATMIAMATTAAAATAAASSNSTPPSIIGINIGEDAIAATSIVTSRWRDAIAVANASTTRRTASGLAAIVNAAVAATAAPTRAPHVGEAASLYHMRLFLTVVHLLLVTLGTANLLIVFLVATRPYMRTVTNIYITSLCIGTTTINMRAKFELKRPFFAFSRFRLPFQSNARRRHTAKR